MTEYLKANWPWLAPLAAYVLINILNIFTKHYSEKKGFVKFCLVLVELLSFVTSKNTAAGIGLMKKFKLPGQVIPPSVLVEEKELAATPPETPKADEPK